MADMRRVAELASVSLGTVSNVLNRPHLVSEQTRRRVEQAIAETGFVRNGSARQLRAGHSPLIGLIVLDGSKAKKQCKFQGLDILAEIRYILLYLDSALTKVSKSEREAIFMRQSDERR